MIDAMDRLCDMLYKALDEVSEKPLTTSSLDNIFKIVGSIYKLEKMEKKMMVIHQTLLMLEEVP